MLPPPWTWQRRRQRAAELAQAHPETAAALAFYADVAEVQETLARHAGEAAWLLRALRKGAGADEPGADGQGEGGRLPVARFRLILALAERRGPEALARAARRLLEGGVEAQEAAVGAVLTPGRGPAEWSADPAEAMLVRLFLEPFAEEAAARQLRGTGGPDGRPAAGGAQGGGAAGEGAAACPMCGAPPQVGHLVGVEGGEGALFLDCSVCRCAWRHVRLRCTACGAAGGLVNVQPEGAGHVRLDTCERCRGYLKVFDLRVDGRAVPPVDDLATVGLDLWAREQGFSKPVVNLAGV